MVVQFVGRAYCGVGLGRRPGSGRKWEIETGEQKSLSAALAIPELQVDGELTLENGAVLSVSGEAVNALGTTTEKTGIMTIKNGASATFTGTLDAAAPGDSQGLALGAADGFGTVTVEAGGALTVEKGRLFLGRNGSNDNRNLTSKGVLNIYGTVTAPTLASGAWYASADSSKYGSYVLDEIAIAGEINLEEGGVLETRRIYCHDISRTIFNFKGGTLRALAQNDNFISGQGIMINIEEGKNLIFDTNGYHIRILPSSVQPDFFQIKGAGGFIKRGAGYLQICDYAEQNTFTGPIVVEEGIFSLGRALAEGQTVYVKKGAQFYPAGAGDIGKITYEDPTEAAGGLYSVQTRLYDGLDLLGMGPTYFTDALGGPIWGWGGEVHGTVTHSADISPTHPFNLVGQGYQLNLYDTGLQDLPLTLSGTGTFMFGGNYTNTADNTITFTGSAKYLQQSEFAITGDNGAMPTLTVSGPGTFQVNSAMRVGCEGKDGEFYVKDGATVNITGELRIGGNASTRQKVKGRVIVENASLNNTGSDTRFAPNTLIDGSDYDTLFNELILNPGGNMQARHFNRNDDARSRIVFAGGTMIPSQDSTDFLTSGQNGTFEVEAKANSDIRFNIGTKRIGITSEHTHIFGDGGLEIIGNENTPDGVFTLGKTGLSDFEVTYAGGTKITGATLKLNVPLPEGNAISGSRGTIDIGGNTIDNPSGDVKVKGPGTVVIGRDNADATLTQQLDGVQLLKIGTGALTLDTAFDGALTVREGSATVNGVASYSSYRFKVENIKGPSNAGGVNSMQLAELILLNGTTDVTRPYKSTSFDTNADNNGSTYPAKEAPGNLVDGKLTTKWLDYRAHPNRSAADRDRVWLRIDYDQPKTITGYIWVTANDTPGRDPSAWRLQGSNDGGTTWTDLDVQTDYAAVDTRFCPSELFTVGGAFGSATVVTVEPGATLRVDGGNVPVSMLDNNGTVELVNGATLTSNGGYINGTVTGTGALEVNGGEVTLVGNSSYTGDTHVSAGVLNVGAGINVPTTRGFDGKFFRLTIKRSNGGNNGSGANNFTLQASEFKLYNADGVMQNKGLTMQGVGIAATSLNTNSFTCADSYANATGDGTEVMKNLFDDDTSTKWYCGDAVNGKVPNYHVITMRLADDADPITSYNFFTADDMVRRSPTDWTLEGSRDGVTWEKLDERFWAPHTTYTDQKNYSDASIRTKPFNNGVNYEFETLARPLSFKGKFLRFTFKKTAGNTMLQLSELLVLNALGGNEAYGLTKAADATPAASLQPGTFCKGGSYSTGSSSEDMEKLFDDNTNTKLCANNNNMSGAAANYRVLTMRLKDDALPVNGYVFVTANDSLNRSPCDWMVEGSEDGETWVTLDERAGVAQPYCLFTAMNAGHPFTFDSLADDGTTLPAGSCVQVDAGAVMNLNSANATIDNLRVDCTLGGGTIASFRPAENGVLDLVNLSDTSVAALDGMEIPLTVTDIKTAENLPSWKVAVNGVARDGLRIRLNEEGKLTLFCGGTLIIIE